MYTKTKLFSILTITSILAFTLSSCGGVNINETESIKKIGTTINENLEKGSLVTRVSLSCSSSSHTGWDVQSVSVDYINAKAETRELYIPLAAAGNKSDRAASGGIKMPDSPFIKEGPEKGRDIVDYDFSQLAKNIENAIKQSKESGIESISGLERYSIDFYKDATLDEHSWTLLSQATDTKLEGRKITTEYYQLKFNADATGSVTAGK